MNQYISKPAGDTDWCGLKDDPHFIQCCCNCKHHLEVHYHCGKGNAPTEQERIKFGSFGKCGCMIRKGWACVLNMGEPFHETRVYDNWPEHSCGCECYDPIDKKKQEDAEQFANDSRHDFMERKL